MLKQTLRDHLIKSYSDGELRQWFDPLRVEMCDEERCLCISFPHSFFAQWFANKIQDTFEKQLHMLLGPGYMLRYMDGAHVPDNGNSPRQAKAIDYPFGHTFTFDNFITNKKNYFPLATAQEVAKSSDAVFNPFVVHGGNGAGKTHLLKAIANEVSKKIAPETIFFGNVEDLYNIYSVKFAGEPFKARKYVENFSILLVDEFQLIGRFKSFQNELINIFNQFYDSKKQMIFACKDKLSGCDFLDPKLKSRLEWGLIVSIVQPDLDVRIRYIERNCRSKKIKITKEHILTLAQRFQDLRFLQGILLKFYAFKEFVHKDISDQDFQHIVQQTAGSEKKAVRPEVIMDTVAGHFNLSRKDLLSAKRHQAVVQARQLAMFLCRELVGSSYPSLGRMFGGRDHSTALYAVKKINQKQSSNKDTKNLVAKLRKKCLANTES